MRVQVEDTEINGASVAVRRQLTPITGTDAMSEMYGDVSELRTQLSRTRDTVSIITYMINHIA